ncbi:MAG: RagB/SusD family nutrient uptake outer membrane protein [Prevotellaceae bacterium]|nr:RagB/SusD family nutrient uptake outer membrane protein [Prevotellaceae bacterium]
MKIFTHIYKGIAIAVIAASMTSCNNLFDDAPLNTLSEETTWDNTLMLDEYVNTWYRGMGCGFDTYVFTMSQFSTLSRYYLPWFGDQISVGKSDWFNSGYGDILKDNLSAVQSWAKGIWTDDYTQIQYINTFLENSDKVKDEKQKQRVLGEAYFFRAYYYYMLWRRFGGVLLIDHVIDPLQKVELTPRASYEQMVAFIVADAEKAIGYLPEKNDATNAGRVTKGTAAMLKAKTYFWAASEVYQNKEKDYLGFTDNKSEEMLKKAKAAYEDLFNMKLYSLIQIKSTTEDGIKQEYRNIFLTKNSEESMLEIQHTDDGDYDNKYGHRLDREAAAPSFTGTTAAYTPTHNHALEYGMRDGETYDPQHPFDNRDYRFYANILYDGCTFRGHTMDIHYTDNKAGEDLTAYGTSTSAAVTRTGYYLGKFVDETQTIDDNDTYASKQNFIIWRYAEAILDYAEVAYRLGFTDIALEQINLIRSRVHMNEYNSITLDKILNERRVEMAFEETVYWDHFRLGNAVEKLSGETNPLKTLRVDYKKGNGPTYSISNMNKFPKRVRVFSEKDYYFPIPWDEVKAQDIEQNPYWDEV